VEDSAQGISVQLPSQQVHEGPIEAADHEAVGGCSAGEVPVISRVGDDGSFESGRTVPQLEDARACAPILHEGRIPAAEQCPGGRAFPPFTSRSPERNGARTPVAYVPVAPRQGVASERSRDRGSIVGNVQDETVADNARVSGLTLTSIAELSLELTPHSRDFQSEAERTTRKVEHRAPVPERRGSTVKRQQSRQDQREQRHFASSAPGIVSNPPPSYRSPACTSTGMVLPRQGAGQGYTEL
jgi:hypothetical protein